MFKNLVWRLYSKPDRRNAEKNFQQQQTRENEENNLIKTRKD